MRVEFDEAGAIGARIVAPAAVGDAPAATGDKAPPHLSFDLPPRVFAALIGVAIGYVAVMGFAFRAGAGMGLILAIFTVVLAGFYGLPVFLARGGPRHDRRGAWGIDTASGYLPGGAAWAQIMTVPVLMLGWALFVAIAHP